MVGAGVLRVVVVGQASQGGLVLLVARMPRDPRQLGMLAVEIGPTLLPLQGRGLGPTTIPLLLCVHLPGVKIDLPKLFPRNEILIFFLK